MDAGADSGARNAAGHTPAEEAVRNGMEEVVGVLEGRVIEEEDGKKGVEEMVVGEGNENEIKWEG